MQHFNNSIEIVLDEYGLNDNTMIIAPEGYHFNGNPKHTVLVYYYTYCNEWCNHEHHFFAESIDNALKRYFRLMKTDKARRVEINALVDDIMECQ